ncbi:MAG TPA: S8 family serine peptidase [Acidimicrobiales bacterium]|nr:S8 family serine peptidase [Acidimicrobiales bacterium]
MDYSKVSPSLAAAFDDYQEQGRPALAAHQRTLGVVSVEPTAKPARVVAFLHAAGGASLDHLAELGVEVNEGEGPIRTGIVPLDVLSEVTDDPALARIVPARRLRPVMDVATVKVNVPQLRRTSRLSGRGVVVGTVDTGIEPTHPDFAGRILRIWDQTLNGPGVREGAYGAELTGDLMQVSRDTIGHGTHVAGIAAGDDPTYGGIAPAAELVIVKSDLLTAHIADGVRYIVRVAAELGRPAVVNLSLGGHGDAHDGTDSLSAIVDAVSGAGRIVCCSAGNEGNDNIHAVAQLPAGRLSFTSMPMALPPIPAGQRFPVAALNGWYSAEDDIQVAVASPAGAQTPFQGVIAEGSPARTYQLPDGAVRITTPGPDPANGDINFFVQFQPAPTPPGPLPPRAGAWRLRLRGRRVLNGRVDVWSIDEFAAQLTGPSVQDNMKIGSPGAATRAITVASYTTKVEWQDIFGNPRQTGLDLDDISEFSSEGPRRDGEQKPDVAAPGAMIASALSVHSPVNPAFLVDDLHRVMAGTSMACPFVSGLVALLLERTPTLRPEAAKRTLRNHSAIPGQPKGAFDIKWGYGLIDAARLAPRPKAVKKAAKTAAKTASR